MESLARRPLIRAQPTLAATLDDRDNSYTLVRLFAASLVIVSHSFVVLTGSTDAQPLSWAAYDLGAIAVNIFFVLSGVMISRSFALRPNLLKFAKARLLRIYPGLLFAAVVTAVVIGPIATELPLTTYWSHLETWIYPLRVAYEFAAAHLPDVFTNNPRQDTNASLWTIKYELLAYLGFMIVAALGFTRRKWWLLLALAISAIAVISGIGMDGHHEAATGSIARFSFCFVSGMVAYTWLDQMRLSPLAAGIGVVVALSLSATPIGEIVSVWAFGYAALTLGSIVVPMPEKLRRTDISYGLYLYGWPVQQVISHRVNWGGAMVLAHIATTIVVAGLFATVSWFLIEKPALRWK